MSTNRRSAEFVETGTETWMMTTSLLDPFRKDHMRRSERATRWLLREKRKCKFMFWILFQVINSHFTGYTSDWCPSHFKISKSYLKWQPSDFLFNLTILFTNMRNLDLWVVFQFFNMDPKNHDSLHLMSSTHLLHFCRCLVPETDVEDTCSQEKLDAATAQCQIFYDIDELEVCRQVRFKINELGTS